MTKKGEIMDSIKAKTAAVRGYLSLPQTEATNRTYVLLILVAYIFSVAIHAYWFKVYGGNEIFRFNGEYIITSPDGWFFGKGAKDALAGAVGIADGNMQVASLAKLAAVLKSVLPFLSLETIMFYSPVVIGSLSVIPLVLIGRLYSQPIFGLLSALFVVSLPGFYGRMGFGYFDDDLLTLQMPLWVLFATLFVARERNTASLATLAITVILYQWWYPKSFSIISALAIMLLIYTVVFKRREFGLYFAVAVMLLGLTDMPLWLRAFGVLSIVYFYDTISLMSQKARVAFILSVVAVFAMLGGFEPMIGPFKMYIFRRVAEASGSGLHYFTSLKTVSESASISFDVLANNFAMRKELFFIAIAGMAGMLLFSRSFVMVLPIFFIGLLSIDAGSRFTPYGNMAVGISLAFLFTAFFVYLKRIRAYIAYPLVLAASCGFLFLAYERFKGEQGGPAFSTFEISTLQAMSVYPKDSVVFSWWDYGYPVMFYSGLNTMTDGGRQGGEGSYVESSALLSPDQRFSARLYREVAENGGFESFLTKRHFGMDPNEVLASMFQDDYNTTAPTKAVYLVMPYRMAMIYATVAQFGNINVENGKPLIPLYYEFFASPKDETDRIALGDGKYIDKKTNSFVAHGVTTPLSTVTKVEYGENILKPKVTKVVSGAKSGINAVYDTRRNCVAILSDGIKDSLFVKLFFEGAADERYFVPVYQNQSMAVYKIML